MHRASKVENRALKDVSNNYNNESHHNRSHFQMGTAISNVLGHCRFHNKSQQIDDEFKASLQMGTIGEGLNGEMFDEKEEYMEEGPTAMNPAHINSRGCTYER